MTTIPIYSGHNTPSTSESAIHGGQTLNGCSQLQVLIDVVTAIAC